MDPRPSDARAANRSYSDRAGQLRQAPRTAHRDAVRPPSHRPDRARHAARDLGGRRVAHRRLRVCRRRRAGVVAQRGSPGSAGDTISGRRPSGTIRRAAPAPRRARAAARRSVLASSGRSPGHGRGRDLGGVRRARGGRSRCERLRQPVPPVGRGTRAGRGARPGAGRLAGERVVGRTPWLCPVTRGRGTRSHLCARPAVAHGRGGRRDGRGRALPLDPALCRPARVGHLPLGAA